MKELDIGKHCVIRIDNLSKQRVNILNPYEDEDEMSYGTGFFVTSKYILTNHHVVQNARKLYVTIPGKDIKSMEAHIMWLQKELDYAILYLKDSEYKPRKIFPLGDSSKLVINDVVSVIGYPLAGHYNNMKGYEGKISGWEDNKIQHDTNTNPGMSGSPIIHQGKVVGLHKEGYASESIPGNIMFAATINSINLDRIFKSQLNHGYIHIPSFPFLTQPISSVMMKYFRDQLSLPIESGILVNKGDDNNIKSGDIILSINSHDVSCKEMIDFHKNKECIMHYKLLSQYMMGGDPLIIKLIRRNTNGTYKTIHRSTKMKGPKLGQKLKTKYNYNDVFVLGDIMLHNINKKIFSILDESYQYAFVNNEINGVMISHIFPYTLTERDNILDVGTIVSEINGQEIHSIKDIKQILGKSEPISQNNYIELRTVDNKFYVIQKHVILDNANTEFSKWKIPNDSFYGKQSKKWLADIQTKHTKQTNQTKKNEKKEITEKTTKKGKTTKTTKKGKTKKRGKIKKLVIQN